MDCPQTSKLVKDPDISNSQIESNEIQAQLKELFKCYLCSLEETYEYKGTSPPFSKHVAMIEDCYMIEDPFLPPKSGEFLALGSDCSICQKQVCKANGCSFFYCQTYCIECVKLYLNKFPNNVQMKVNKILKS